MIILRYLTKEVYAIAIAATLVLFFIFMSNQLIHYLYYAAEGALTAKLAMQLLVFKSPVLLGALLPLSLYLAILLGYGRLYADNEMTVLFACGVSQRTIFNITMKFAAVVAILTALLMLFVGPPFNKQIEKLMTQGVASPIELISPGRFQSVDNDKLIFYTDKTSRNRRQLYDVFASQQQNEQQAGSKQGILVAKKAYQKFDPKTGDVFVVFENGNRYFGTPGQPDYQIVGFDQYWVRIKHNSNPVQYDKDAVPTFTLLSDHSKLGQAELQWRLAMPIMALILAMLAVPLSRVKGRQGRFIQLIPAILLYIVYSNFLMLSRGWIRQDSISPLIGMWWIHLLMFATAIYLNIRQSGWRKILQAFKS